MIPPPRPYHGSPSVVLCQEIVQHSDVLLLLQTQDVLTRPWVLLELWTAIKNNVPVVAVAVAGACAAEFRIMNKSLHFENTDSFHVLKL